ncbi:hypothetical protein [Mucilaginibacter sp.]
MAKDYDMATPTQIEKWKKDVPMRWVFERYMQQVRSTLIFIYR